MSKSKPEKQSQAVVAEIAIENYEEIFDAVEDGALCGVVIGSWYKGLDIEIDGGDEFRDFFAEFFHERCRKNDFDCDSNRICIDLYTKGEKLFFDVSVYWVRSADCFRSPEDGWSEGDFQNFVFNLLKEKIKKQIIPEDLDISISVECENQNLKSYCINRISDRAGNVDEISVTPKKEKLIGKYVIDWYNGNEVNQGDDASIEITDSSGVSVKFEEGDEKEVGGWTWLVTPPAKKTKQKKP